MIEPKYRGAQKRPLMGDNPSNGERDRKNLARNDKIHEAGNGRADTYRNLRRLSVE